MGEYDFAHKGGNHKEMNKSLKCVDWDALLSDNSVSQKWAIFKEVLDNAVTKFVPNRKGGLDKNIYGGQEVLNRSESSSRNVEYQ